MARISGVFVCVSLSLSVVAIAVFGVERWGNLPALAQDAPGLPPHRAALHGAMHPRERMKGRRKEEEGRRKEERGRREGGRSKEEGGRRKKEGGRRMDEGGMRKEEGGRRNEEGGRKE